MASLNLTSSDQVRIRSSWADVLALNHFNDQDFVKELFSNLLDSDANVRAVLKDPSVLREQECLFNDMLKFAMMYLDNAIVLEECMDGFIKENPSIVKHGVTYLEPLGAVLIRTLRLFLGSDKFHAGLETLWIKLFIFLANSVLLNDASDVESVISNKDMSLSLPSSFEEEIQPLNCKQFCSPVPNFSSSSSFNSQLPKISVDLGANEKYRGFRRSITETSRSKVTVPVPLALCSPSSSGSILSVKSEEQGEPVLTPRSHRRTACQVNQFKVKEEKTINSPEKTSQLGYSSTFDPRRRFSHKRNPSDLSLNMDQPERKTSISSLESTISDLGDELYLAEDDMDFGSGELRIPVFDQKSFGIAALAPIAESEDDEEKSQYSSGDLSATFDSTQERSSCADATSRTSSLSLQSLNYKSSVSSGSGSSKFMDKTSRAHARVSEVQEPLRQFANPYSQNRFLSSVPSLVSKSSGQRASMGFMRSSFILKKEMNDLGYNLPENVLPPVSLTGRQLSSLGLRSSRSVASLPVTRSKEVSPGKVVSGKTFGARTSTIPESTSQFSAQVLPNAERSSFMKKLRNFFSSTPAPSRQSNLAKHVPPPRASVSEQATGSLSSSYSGNRISSSDIRGKPAPVGYAASIYLKPTVFTDNATITSTDSRRSSFSFFKKRDDPKKANKYLVKRLPYKTVSLKDIIS